MKIFSSHGYNEFIVCAGYKAHMIKDYFANYRLWNSNVIVDMSSGKITLEGTAHEPWTVSIIDTGEATMTGGRIKRILPYLGEDQEFMMTYGDGVADIDIPALIDLHRSEGRLATVTGVQPPGRFGQLRLRGNAVEDFLEKPDAGEGGWINGGFFILPASIGLYIENDMTTFEREPLERLSTEDQLSIYRHMGFWLPMDSLRDKNTLESLWASGDAPWKRW
jgi:glucose-1-phosphate cytidylyltransferase